MEIDNLKNVIDEYLKNYFINRNSYNKVVYESAGYSVNIGGKRIRPILLILTYSLYKDNIEKIMPMAAAIEMIHTYSLIHDDLPCMDDDDLRRGKPTNHKVFGENIAVLAGDALLNEAMTLLMKSSLELGESALKASYEISKAAGPEGMIGGQVVDVLSEVSEISKEELEYMHEKKTGELIRVSIVAGGILARVPSGDIEALNEYGKKLGLAFQIKDDILDVIGTKETLGKATNRDKELNKTNFITVYGLEKCEELCKMLTDECIKILDNLSVDASLLKELTHNLLNRLN
ncbi:MULTISPECIES: polyprenyl synthetase family protein [unclassified Clostridium]|uniref:Farnesyl diphosphate synthase n=1 Tax=Clostridium botulinum (strain Eklund 17B / Type B) TaxID=935198 RepID=B2TRM6_CLOBB|nr:MULTISPECIES: farnesyl diphosphate synthase [unclassified Clostridium]ACD21704.1 putative geranyltranstransferase [Clostridium botulinum B str. Eklund 17B (NRP)]MBN1039079.1 polyprenyl synthetase family protein [Clostridium botulinum]MBN1045894.1 polyprenyl synthetase family protein [Clostridium botulinum]MBN1055821.1 polyprenyl synthetase family protein [Clostridium botulinum]MBY6975922.1 polyprenyl synthetase family protein [Clostridium botulinum]